MFFSKCDFLDYSIRQNLHDIIPTNEMSEYCEMNGFESAFICGLIKKFKPRNILEVGVASGGSSAIILEAIKTYTFDTNLISVDISPEWYRKKQKKQTGWQAIEKFGNLPNWSLHTGSYLPEIIEQFGVNFDLCIIDTVHMLPGELLDYLCAIKFMKIGANMVFHNTQLFHTLLYYPKAYATKVLLDASVGQKYYFIDENSPLQIPNICGFRINLDTYKYLDNCFSALSMKWSYAIDEKQYEIYNAFFSKYYGRNYCNFFKKSYENNIRMLNYYKKNNNY